MSKWSTWCLVGGVLLVAALAVPPGVESLVADVLRDRLAERRVDLEWRELHWSWTDRVTLDEVRLRSPGGRDFEMRRLEADLGVARLLTGEIYLDAVRVVGLRGALDLSPSGESPGSAQGGREEPGAGAIERARALLRRISVVRLEGASVDLVRDGRRLTEWRGDLVVARGGRGLAGRGELRVGAEANAPVAWKLDGELDAAVTSAKGRLAVGTSDSPARLAGGPLRVGLEGLSFEVSLAPTPWAETTLEAPTLRLGDDEPLVEMAAPRVSLVAARGPEVAPHLSVGARELRTIVDTRVATLLSPGSEPDGGGSPAETGGMDVARLAPELFQTFVESVEVDLRQIALRLRHSAGDRTQTLAPTESLRLEKRGRRLAVAGNLADGRIEGTLGWEAGSLWPDRAGLWIDGLDLEQIPIVREGRSLPNRGVRGELGGRLEVAATLMRLGLPGTLGERTAGRLRVDWRDGWIEADGLADAPLREIDTSVRLSGEWRPAINRLRLREGRFRYADLRARLGGALVDWPIDPVFSFEADFERFDCQEAVGSLPDVLLGPYRQVALAGEAEPSLGLEVPLRRPSELTLDLEGFPGECAVTALNADREAWPDLEFRQPDRDDADGDAEPSRRHAAPPTPKHPLDEPRPLASVPSTWNPARPDDVFWLKKTFAKRVTEGVSDGAEVEVGPGLASYVPLEQMPPYVGGAAYLSEEVNFYRDGAWNVGLIEKALRMNFEEERFVYGGSTITQQLVKNLFLTRRKTLARKVREALVAWRIQGVVRKDRVLELYLNCIEFGEDLYGIGPAARHYFDKPAADLTPLEAVFLAVIKPAPWYGDRFMARGETPESGWWPERIDEIMGRLVDKGFVDASDAKKARPYVLTWDDEDEGAAQEGGADSEVTPRPPDSR